MILFPQVRPVWLRVHPPVPGDNRGQQERETVFDVVVSRQVQLAINYLVLLYLCSQSHRSKEIK